MELNLNLLRNTRCFDKLYHAEIISQHNQYYVFNKLRDLNDACKQDRDSYEPLNVANLMLANRLRKICNQLNEDNIEITRRAAEEINSWKLLYNQGGVYASFRYAKQICSYLKSVDYPIEQVLINDSELIRAFTVIPYSVKSFFQIHMIVSDEDIVEFFNRLNDSFKPDAAIFYYLFEIKISRFVFQYAQSNCRNVKIILLPGLVNSIRNPIIRSMCQLLDHALVTSTYVPTQRDQYSLPVSDKLSLSQGNFQYKQFLSLLGALELVYDPDHNYALINNN